MTDTGKPYDAETVTAEVQRIVVAALHAQKSANSVAPETRLETLGLDSLNVVDVLLGIEETFDISVDDAAIEPETVETIGTLVTFVLEQLGKR